jgi:hypothetical protein
MLASRRYLKEQILNNIGSALPCHIQTLLNDWWSLFCLCKENKLYGRLIAAWMMLHAWLTLALMFASR